MTYGNNPGENMPQKFSSDYNPSDPAQSKFYLAPANSTQSMDLKITSPSDIAQFIGSGTLQLPVAGNAFSSFMSTSGNGSGTVLTTASADVSVTYEYVTAQPEFVPEPGAVLIWGLGGIGSLVMWRVSAGFDSPETPTYELTVGIAGTVGSARRSPGCDFRAFLRRPRIRGMPGR